MRGTADLQTRIDRRPVLVPHESGISSAEPCINPPKRSKYVVERREVGLDHELML